jgi:hypothetical protein
LPYDLPIFPQEHLGQIPQREGFDRGYWTEQVPAVPSETQDAETVRQCDEGHHEEEGAEP